MTKFVIVPELQQSLGIKSTAESSASGKSKPGADAKKVSVPLDKLLVNVAGTMGSRYLLVSVTLVGTGGEAFKTKITENSAQLRDMAMGTLANKTLADLEKPGARNLIRTELINGFNNVLGDNSVTEIFITEFGIQ
jgi:flagellar FliL protein